MAETAHLLSILRLGASGYDKDGWVWVSRLLWPLVTSLDHGGLLEFKPGHLRLTSQGRVLLWVVQGTIPSATHAL